MTDTTVLVRLLAPALRQGTAYRDLAGALRGLVLDGRVVAGDRLPAERLLAQRLGVSRTTVSAALALLRADGYVQSRQGSGSVVALPPDRVQRPDEPPRPDPADIDLTVAALPAPSLLGTLAVEAAHRLAGSLSGHGMHPLGLPELRSGLARRLTGRGLPTEPEQLLVTQGALHGWDLVLRAYAAPGHLVVLEQPMYAASLDAARAHRVRTQPMAVSQEGWQLPDRLAGLVLVTPDYQNPTGFVASEAQRRTMLRRARGSLVVTDETFAELSIDGDRPGPPLAGLDNDVVTLGSLSKLVWSGLRIGWVRARPEVITRLATLRTAIDVASPVLDQLVATALLPHLDQIARDRAPMLQSRRDALLQAVHAAGWRTHRPAGGLSLWVDLAGVSSTRLAGAAHARGVRITPGTRFSLTGTHDRWLRLPFSNPEPVLLDAVDRLRAAAADQEGKGRRSAPARWTA